MLRADIAALWPDLVGRLRGKATVYGLPSSERDDAVQEVFLRIYRNRESIKDVNHLRRYAFAALRSYAIDQHRRSRNYEVDTCPELLRDEHTVSIEGIILVGEVREATAQMPPTYAATIAAYLSRDSLADLSRTSGVPATTIHGREKRAIQRLRRLLLRPPYK